MPAVQELKTRLNEIAESLKNSHQALALLGLGSIGLEQERLDEYSDLDFFVIAKNGEKHNLINNLSWLTNVSQPGYSFQNTVDGHKFLYEDGVFCEFAVFEQHELEHIPFARGQLVWAEYGFDSSVLEPTDSRGQYNRNDDINWIIGESLTNLFVGLGRYRRGEKQSAFNFVQSFSIDRILDLIHLTQPTAEGLVDIYMPDRRIESRIPTSENLLKQFCQGYSKTPESALAQLNWLEKNFDINPVISVEIRQLANQ